MSLTVKTVVIPSYISQSTVGLHIFVATFLGDKSGIGPLGEVTQEGGLKIVFCIPHGYRNVIDVGYRVAAMLHHMHLSRVAVYALDGWQGLQRPPLFSITRDDMGTPHKEEADKAISKALALHKADCTCNMHKQPCASHTYTRARVAHTCIMSSVKYPTPAQLANMQDNPRDSYHGNQPQTHSRQVIQIVHAEC